MDGLDLEPIIERSKDLDRITVWFPEPHKTTLKQFLTDQESLISEVIELRRTVDHLQNWCGDPDNLVLPVLQEQIRELEALPRKSDYILGQLAGLKILLSKLVG